MKDCLVFIGIFVLFGFLGWLSDIWSKAHKYRQLKPRLDNLDSYKSQLESKETDLTKKQSEWEKKKQADTEAIHILSSEKSQGFPWLAQAYADYFYLQDMAKARQLEVKSHPAFKAAERVKEIASERRIAEKLQRILKYQLQYYENLFPWLIDFKSEDVDELLTQILNKKKGKEFEEEPDDPVKKWVTEAEYEKLPRAEKNQLALDRYWKKKKAKWEIGRDYERYVGYLYEKSGCSVYYQGIIEGLEDLGRDLITKKGQNIEVIQCKCWSQAKTIHEKHIFQLYGTTIEYWLKDMEGKKLSKPHLFPELLREERIKASFYTSTKLSEKARKFAEALGVQIIENFPFQRYPSIKCNVSMRTSEKIYHLPFDQQYDRTVIEEERNEGYVETVKEAEALGFRRAYRWRGEPTK